ncbi:unnamed protein product, partial [Brachionus calyciflorus]
IKHYNEKNGWGTASLVNDGSDQLKIIGRIFIENTTSHFVILPFHHSSNNKHSRSNSISHVIFKKNLESSLFHHDYIGKPIKIDKPFIRQRAVNGQPVSLIVEATAVVDISIQNSYKRYLKTNDDNIVRDAIRTYYSYVFAGVNEKYQRTLENDPDLKIAIKLTNILILSNPSDLEWADSKVNALPGLTRNDDGKEIINGTSSLDRLAQYMNNQKFSFEFDVAVVVFDKDVKDSANDDYAGLAYTSGVCQNTKYSINEDDLSFGSIYVRFKKKEKKCLKMI